MNDLLVNLIGRACLGFCLGFRVNNRSHLVFCIGFCGAITTFSSWIFKCMDLILSGAVIEALILLFFTLFAGLILASFGFLIGRRVKMPRHFQ